MINGRRAIFFTASFLLLSIILMMTMIRDCDGWMMACNGSTTAECQVIEDEEQEFFMDTEEHRRLLATAKSHPHLSYDVLKRGVVACEGCAGAKKRYTHRGCKTYDRLPLICYIAAPFTLQTSSRPPHLITVVTHP
ncbi:hypothetical protein L1887_36514 [Cichorium endivia]|nr:hypothetical protein L1887_36514 [Cichorium endivia]